ncbi:MAG: DUF2452 domain-containing protein [Saprospiraceae bacterium]
MAKEKNGKEEVKEEFINPIDKDKIAENPGLLPYAHTVGGSVIKPIDEGRVKGNALAAMEQQTDMQMAQLYKQMELLAKQAEAIKKRKEISENIYLAKMSFEPKIGHAYFLYEKESGESVVSLVAPNEWGRRGMPFSDFVAKVRLLADHTWDIIEE